MLFVIEHIHGTIGYLITQICKAHRGCAEDHLNPFGLYAGQEMFLMYLWDQDGQTQTHIADKMGVQPPTVNKMLSRMEGSGLVVRRADEDDLRVSRVYLTDKGKTLRAEVRQAWDAMEAQTTAGMTQEERLLLRRLLLQVHSNLVAE